MHPQHTAWGSGDGRRCAQRWRRRGVRWNVMERGRDSAGVESRRTPPSADYRATADASDSSRARKSSRAEAGHAMNRPPFLARPARSVGEAEGLKCIKRCIGQSCRPRESLSDRSAPIDWTSGEHHCMVPAFHAAVRLRRLMVFPDQEHQALHSHSRMFLACTLESRRRLDRAKTASKKCEVRSSREDLGPGVGE